MATNTQMTMMMHKQSPNCPLFNLAGELRNQIYDLVLEISNDDTLRVTDAFSVRRLRSRGKTSAAPPSAGLTRCCQRIYNETKRMFDEASEQYWGKTFVLGMTEIERPPRFRILIDSIPTHMIHKLYFMVSIEGRRAFKIGLFRDEKGIWNVTGSLPTARRGWISDGGSSLADARATLRRAVNYYRDSTKIAHHPREHCMGCLPGRLE